jgi:microcystin-dependent protein
MNLLRPFVHFHGSGSPAAGQGRAHENRQPYLGMNYIIAVQGLFQPHE